MTKVKTGSRAPLRFRVSTNILDLLGVNMYSSVPKAISEVVVNGYDADATIVWVRSEADRIVIEDNGDAMDEAAIRDQYMFLASRHKRRQTLTSRLHRKPIGAKGIGKLAGLGIAQRIEIETWRDGVMHRYALDRDEIERADRGGSGEAVLDRASIPLEATRTREEGTGTRVTLTKLRREIRYDAKKVREHLAQELPLSPFFRVNVDGTDVTRNQTPGRRIAIRHEDPICGLIDGYLIVAKKRIPQPGVLTTVRGRAVGGPSFFSLDVSARRYHSTDFITGQVECAGLDPDDGTASAIKTDREGFTTNHPRYEAFAAYMTEQIRRVAKDIEDGADARREAERHAHMEEAVARVTDVLNAFNDHVRRMMSLTSVATDVRGHRDDNGKTVTHPVVDAEVKGGERPRTDSDRDTREPTNIETLPVTFGSGRLRFRNQTYRVIVEPRGEAAPECEIVREEAVVVVNEQHPSYEDAVRNRWTEVVVLRAVAARFAVEESGSAVEAYGMVDDILRFAAKRSARRTNGAIDAEEDVLLAPTG